MSGTRTDVDTSDRVFLQSLKEIEKTYTTLPKALRIRVERWVDKLSVCGTNQVWKRHRNLYVKLLLNQVVTQNLSEPFHELPPDGALPSFPTHVLSKFPRDLVGPHETSFWRDVYSKVSNSKPLSSSKLDSNITDTSMLYSSSILQSPKREIANLKLLIAEQNQRIKVLEQQLRDERIQHELQLQMRQSSHRYELGKNRIDNPSIQTSLEASLSQLHLREPSMSDFSVRSLSADAKGIRPFVDIRSSNNSNFIDRPLQSNTISSNNSSLIDRTLQSDFNSRKSDIDDGAFFSYLEKFQDELKMLQSPELSPNRVRFSTS